MKVVLNGQLVLEEAAVVSVFDRGFLYGDGLFETLRLYHGRPFRWAQHMDRLRRGAGAIGLMLPLDPDAMRSLVGDLVRANQMPGGVLRIAVSRGSGPRGYSPRGAGPPTLVLSLHSASPLDPANPRRGRLGVSSFHLPAGDKLAAVKGASKLLQVLARAEAEAQGFDEALLLNTDGEVVEAASSNLFWIEGDTVCTPPLDSGALAGVTRELVLELCAARGLPTQERTITLEDLHSAQAIFLTQSVLEIISVVSLNERPVWQSALVDVIRDAYRDAVRLETGSDESPP
jgi:branched-chain amino acid aminotransferase